jgi:hypothetical protein
LNTIQILVLNVKRPWGKLLLIEMATYEVESRKVKPGREHEVAMRNWLAWVKEHRDLFPEWKSTRYIDGDETERHVMMWEYDSLAAFEEYKARRKDYEGPNKEYKKVDPYYMDVFDHTSMNVEIWKPPGQGHLAGVNRLFF